MGVKVSGAGYRSYRAALEAGNSALDNFLDDLSRQAETNPEVAIAGVGAIVGDP